jgi:hypothetical protein
MMKKIKNKIWLTWNDQITLRRRLDTGLDRDRDRDIWLDRDRQVMDWQIRFEDQSIVWIIGLGLSFKRAPHMVKKRKEQKKYTNSLSPTQVSVLNLSIHVSTRTDSPPARKWELKVGSTSSVPKKSDIFLFSDIMFDHSSYSKNFM